MWILHEWSLDFETKFSFGWKLDEFFKLGDAKNNPFHNTSLVFLDSVLNPDNPFPNYYFEERKGWCTNDGMCGTNVYKWCTNDQQLSYARIPILGGGGLRLLGSRNDLELWNSTGLCKNDGICCINLFKWCSNNWHLSGMKILISGCIFPVLKTTPNGYSAKGLMYKME